MLTHTSLGFLESSSIGRGIEASDALVKEASVELLKASVLARGKYSILLTGPLGEVRSAMRRGREILGDALIHHFTIGDLHRQVLDTLDKRRPVEALEAVGVIETKEAAPAIHAADEAAKAAEVTLIETRGIVPGGKGFVTMTGEVGAVRTAVAAGVAVVPPKMLVSRIVIPMADPKLVATIGK